MGRNNREIQKSMALAGSHFLQKKVSRYSALSRESIEQLFAPIHEVTKKVSRYSALSRESIEQLFAPIHEVTPTQYSPTYLKLKVVVAAESTFNPAKNTTNFPSLCYCICPRLFSHLFSVRN